MTRKVLFVHQNFPGQFIHLAPALIATGKYKVDAISFQESCLIKQVELHTYQVKRGSSKNIHPWVMDFETKVIRAEGVFNKCMQMKSAGYFPDLIIAHPGWGESMFLKDVWPNAKLAIYCEFYYHSTGADVGFDSEFKDANDLAAACKIRIKNLTNLIHFQTADFGISPTYWQASVFPEPFKSKIFVTHDGVDTKKIQPDESVQLNIRAKNFQFSLTKSDEIITFVNRNMEPYRGYHIFMRSLPIILKKRPNVKVLIIGGDDISYGVKSSDGRKWKDIFYEEITPLLTDSEKSRIIFLGKVPYQYYLKVLQLSTVHVYLTYPFVLSWSLIEAMSVGCAIVASDTQPVSEAINHNVNGRLVNFFDFQNLGFEVCNLLEDSLLRKRLGAQARLDAVQKYDLNKKCLPDQLHWIDEIIFKSGG